MIKFLFFSLALLLAFDASAVRQSVSKALSYRNVVEASRVLKHAKKPQSATTNKNIMNNPVTLPQKDEKVDMTESDMKTIRLKKNDTVEITLKEEKGYFWKVSPSSDLSMQTNKINDNLRVVKYKMLSNETPLYIYFDYIKTGSNNIEKSKQLTINSRD